jgi:hypothetical protein
VGRPRSTPPVCARFYRHLPSPLAPKQRKNREKKQIRQQKKKKKGKKNKDSKKNVSSNVRTDGFENTDANL